MSQSYDFGDLDIQQTGGQEEAEFGALELQQAQVLFTSLNKLREGLPLSGWEAEATAEIEVETAIARQLAYGVVSLIDICFCRTSKREHLRRQLQLMTP